MRKNRIIGFIGRQGCGKDTACEALAQFGYQRLAFADTLYEEVSKAYGVTVAYLRTRETKEIPQERLALANCADTGFKSEMAEAEFIQHDRSASESIALPRSPRWVLQRWGTEYRRKDNTNYWIDEIKDRILASEGLFSIADVRFPEEANMISSLGGILVRVKRESADALPIEHDSESMMLDWPVSFEAKNPEGYPDLLKLSLIENLNLWRVKNA